MRTELPQELLGGPFTVKRAESLGVSRKILRGSRFVRIHRGVYIAANVALTDHHLLTAAFLALPAGAVVSHLTAARLWGFDIQGRSELQFSTNGPTWDQCRGFVVHRRRGQLTPVTRADLPVTGPDRTFVDCATQMSLVELVQFGDHLVHAGHTSPEQLNAYAAARHLDGVQRARLAAAKVIAGSESPMESLVRVILQLTGLPPFAANQWIIGPEGRRIARGDLVDEVHRILVEYDGIHHERDPKQRQRDRERREELEALGYRLIVVTNADLANLKSIPWRVHGALKARGYRGAPPQFGHDWNTWFRIPKM